MPPHNLIREEGRRTQNYSVVVFSKHFLFSFAAFTTNWKYYYDDANVVINERGRMIHFSKQTKDQSVTTGNFVYSSKHNEMLSLGSCPLTCQLSLWHFLLTTKDPTSFIQVIRISFLIPNKSKAIQTDSSEENFWEKKSLVSLQSSREGMLLLLPWLATMLREPLHIRVICLISFST